jgi:MraZ protein
MSSFKGSDIYAVDAKGRVSIPAKMRRHLSPEAQQTFIVTRGLEKCLYAYPLDEWKKLEANIHTLNQADERDRYYLRTLMQWSEELTMDAQSRLLIPTSLLDFAEIKREVYFVGVLDHIELWHPANFKRYSESMRRSYESIASEVMGMADRRR